MGKSITAWIDRARLYPRAVKVRGILTLALLAAACVSPNPAYSPTTTGQGGTDGALGTGTVGGDTSKGQTSAGGGSGGGMSSDGSPTSGGTTSDPGLVTSAGLGSSSTSTSGWSSSTSLASSEVGVLPPDPFAMGYDCENLDSCEAAYPGAECCEAAQCEDTCMLRCDAVEDCPVGMGCEHGYCLFPCFDDDADCADWPGFTCQHGGEYCENDEMG